MTANINSNRIHTYEDEIRIWDRETAYLLNENIIDGSIVVKREDIDIQGLFPNNNKFSESELVFRKPPSKKIIKTKTNNKLPSKEELKSSLYRFYLSVNPSKIKLINGLILNDFKELYEAIYNKYGSVPAEWIHYKIIDSTQKSKPIRKYKNKIMLSDSIKLNRIRILYYFSFFIISCGCSPLILGYSSMILAYIYDCELNEGGINTCVIFGSDRGKQLYHSFVRYVLYHEPARIIGSLGVKLNWYCSINNNNYFYNNLQRLIIIYSIVFDSPLYICAIMRFLIPRYSESFLFSIVPETCIVSIYTILFLFIIKKSIYLILPSCLINTMYIFILKTYSFLRLSYTIISIILRWSEYTDIYNSKYILL